MPKRRLLWQIYLPFLLVIVASLAAASWFTTSSLHDFHLRNLREDLIARTRLFAEDLRARIGTQAPEKIDALCKQLGHDTAARITVILPDGHVIGDSDEDPNIMENHGDRPEVAAAVREGRGTAMRYSHTVRQDMLYVALPLRDAQTLKAVVRTAVPLTAVQNTLHGIYLRIIGFGAIIALAAAGASLFISRRISRPLVHMRAGAERFASGDLAHRLPFSDTEELDGLADAMNRMAAQLDERIHTVVRQRHEMETVLSGMTEGVIGINADERIISINDAAAILFGIRTSNATGRSIQEAIRHPDLHRLAAELLKTRRNIEGDIIIYQGASERHIQVRASVLRDTQSAASGAVFVLNDVTRLRRLESVRRDFVANVSHELRTPITTIRGYLETLCDGGVHDSEKAPQFVDIVMKHVERLDTLIEDLLTLSRIEEQEQKRAVGLEPLALAPVVHSAMSLVQAKADEKGIALELSCDSDPILPLNSVLLEHAIVNLLDNAIKYSNPHSSVEIEIQLGPQFTTIRVRDHGCGIPAEHLPRLFERFYRVDPARSRALGGTGLGLAIAKHIVLLHKGEITVESIPGKGSTFSIHLPGSSLTEI